MIVDKNPSIGALAITSTIANYPGVDRSMSGEALLDQMREQAVQYGTDYRRAQVFLVDTEGAYSACGLAPPAGHLWSCAGAVVSKASHLPRPLSLPPLTRPRLLHYLAGDRKYVYTPDATFVARALVLATGAMGRKPSYKGEDTYLGQGTESIVRASGVKVVRTSSG